MGRKGEWLYEYNWKIKGNVLGSFSVRSVSFYTNKKITHHNTLAFIQKTGKMSK